MSSTMKWREYLIGQLAKDRDEAFGYIQFALEEYQADGDTFVFLLALRTFVASQGGVAQLAKQTRLAPQVLTQMLSGDEAPALDILAQLFNALGCRLTLEPLAEAAPAAETEGERIENVA